MAALTGRALRPTDLSVVLLCGGLGTRMGESSRWVPKPMVEVGGHPLLWHVMQGYAAHGCRRFALCLGHLAPVIRAWWRDSPVPGWEVTLVDTGENSLTGERLRRVRSALPTTGPIFMTYGDGVAAVDLGALLGHHQSMGCLATVTALRARSRFGTLTCQGGRVIRFEEKPLLRERVSGGFFVLEPGAFDAIEPGEAFEVGALARLASAGQLAAFNHDGFWLSVDTPRDLAELNRLYSAGTSPWLASTLGTL
jgi:glucose-1-phosphate cytidylyltransferase